MIIDESGMSMSHEPRADNMTMREYFAAAALVGILSGGPGTPYEDAARMARKHAEALLKELEK